MGRKRRKESAEKKLKKVTVSVLSRTHSGKVDSRYKIMEQVIADHHPHLADAKIVIGWRHEKKQDADGRLWLGSLKKASDLDRSLHEYDFVMLLNHEFVNKAATDQQIEALIDHELCHGAVCFDAHGEVKTDENGRTVYRIRKHDVEEFSEIIARHGAWKKDLESFFGAWKEAKSRPLLDETNQPRKRGPRFSEPAMGTATAEKPAKGKKKAAAADSNGHAATNGHAENWRKLELSKIDGLSSDIVALAANAGVRTLGGLEEFIESEGALGVANIKGMGSERADHLMERVKAYREAHGELFSESEASA